MMLCIENTALQRGQVFARCPTKLEEKYAKVASKCYTKLLQYPEKSNVSRLQIVFEERKSSFFHVPTLSY